MIVIPLDSMHKKMILHTDKEFWLLECAAWLTINVGEKYKDWGFNRSTLYGITTEVWFADPHDATLFRLVFDV